MRLFLQFVLFSSATFPFKNNSFIYWTICCEAGLAESIEHAVSQSILDFGCVFESQPTPPVRQCSHRCYGACALCCDPPSQSEVGALTDFSDSDGNPLTFYHLALSPERQHQNKCFLMQCLSLSRPEM